MPETSPKKFLTPRGVRGANKQGARGASIQGDSWGGGAGFLNSAFMVFLVIFLETLAKIDARNLQENFSF